MDVKILEFALKAMTIKPSDFCGNITSPSSFFNLCLLHFSVDKEDEV